MSARLPAGAVRYAETAVFTEATLPDKLTSAHDTKPGVWGEIIVTAGALDYVVLDGPERRRRVAAGETAVIEPGVRHRVEPVGAVRMQVVFYRLATEEG